jgi:LEA14-like dessication related protein
MLRITCLLVILLFCGSCRNMKDLEFTGIRGFKVNQISVNGIDGELMLGIRNPNSFGFYIYPSNFDVKYSGIALGRAKLHKRVRIRGNAEEVYAFKLKSDFQNVNLLDIMKLLNGATFRNEVEVKGDLRAGKLFFRKSLPVDLKEKITLQ